MANFWLIILTIFGVNSSLIWDPECEGKECSGSPDRGDRVTSFDNWDGSTRSYGTKITYTCAEGFAFDLKGFPSKIENYCGKKCEGWSIGSQKTCFLSQDKSDQAGCRVSGPEWSNKDGKLPRCVLRTTRWKKSVGNNFICPLFWNIFFSGVRLSWTSNCLKFLYLRKQHRSWGWNKSDNPVLQRLPFPGSSSCNQHPGTNSSDDHGASCSSFMWVQKILSFFILFVSLTSSTYFVL